MDKIKLKIFHNLKNFYELSYEIKKEKNDSSKALMQGVARGIYTELNILFRTNQLTYMSNTLQIITYYFLLQKGQ